MYRILISLVFILTVSCNNRENPNSLTTDVDKLKTENDSLKSVLAEIKTKYVFDSVTVANIPHYTNSYKPNSKVRGSIVFVGYNIDTENSRVIMVDSISYNPEKLHNPDTLKRTRGGYQYEMDLDKNEIYWQADIKTQHEYGAKFQGILSDKVTAKSN